MSERAKLAAERIYHEETDAVKYGARLKGVRIADIIDAEFADFEAEQAKRAAAKLDTVWNEAVERIVEVMHDSTDPEAQGHRIAGILYSTVAPLLTTMEVENAELRQVLRQFENAELRREMAALGDAVASIAASGKTPGKKDEADHE